MKGGLLTEISQFLKQHEFDKRWKKLVTVLSAIVVFCTTYMLILPAITMETNVVCGMKEHKHSEECYVQLIKEKELICTEVHEHINGCYSATETEDVLNCGMDEHTHSDLCYNKEDTTAQTDVFGEVAESETTTGTADVTTDVSDATTDNTGESTAENTTGSASATTETSDAVTENDSLAPTDEDSQPTSGVSDENQSSAQTEPDESEIYEKEKDEYVAALDESVASKINELSDEDKESLYELLFVIDSLPTYEEFAEKLDEFYENDDVDGEEEYYLSVQNRMIWAYCYYQGLDGLQKYVFNSDKLFDIKSVFGDYAIQNFTTGTSSAIPFNFINKKWTSTSAGWDSKVITPVVVHGGSVNSKIADSVNRYWYGVVIEYDSSGNYYYVSQVYEAEGASSSSNAKILALEATTSKGFVVLVWTADNSATTAQKQAFAVIQNVEVGDRVTVTMDPTTVSSGYNSGGYGTITFSEYIPPEEPGVEIEEDYVLPEIEDGTSDGQVIDAGGKVTSADKDVVVTKTIDGTDVENVFDITLTVQTKTNVQTFLSEPDMAVVIVMDVSNTMNSVFTGETSKSRYDAAVVAASNFINQFAQNTSGLSKLGFVAFNTHSHEIFDLQPCSTSAQATSLINEMQSETYSILKASGYSSSHDRFTNVEGGLKHGYDMLADSGNSNQYIILLTDGFPTTYLKNNSESSRDYTGYDPYTPSGTVGTDGVFHDDVLGVYCTDGTSYSDKASIKARVMATKIKNSGAKIFSVGVDVAGQTVKKYVDSAWSTGSIVDRTSTTYEIGGANDLNAYKNWLGNRVGSGYYYDSIDQEDITAAFNEIFEEIRRLNSQTKKTVWTATDPLPVLDDNSEIVEFIHFFNINNQPQQELEGEFAVGAEDTAYHEDGIIHWDLKQSGYTTSVDPNDPNTTYYYYSVTYRVRLENEVAPFVENNEYETNGDAHLEYRTIVTSDGIQEISDAKTVYFPKPSVKGYLSELSFLKQNQDEEPLGSAEFALIHNTDICDFCRGDGTPVTTVGVLQENGSVEAYKAVSDKDGNVSFARIPSGHTYKLTETVAPSGYATTNSKFKVVVAYDEITVTETLTNGTEKIWTGESNVITNYTGYVLPATGGPGVTPFYIFGGLLTVISLIVLNNQKKRKKAEGCNR